MSWTNGFWSTKSASKRAVVSAFAVFGLIFAIGAFNANAQSITEGFDNITTLTGAGWFMQNNSVPVGTTGWFQGNSAVFPSQAGAPTSYIGANFNNTTGTNTISNWLLTPNRTFQNGETVTFFTRTVTANPFPDRLQVRLSTNGASTNVGTGAEGVGDFTTVLLDINPNLTVGGYPEVYTQFTITFAGLPAGGASGRVAFRYYVTMGGPTGDNSNYIGIDTFAYTAGGGGGGVCTTSDAQLDYNGDCKSDYAILRAAGPNPGDIMAHWNFATDVGPRPPVNWGVQSDEFVDADYDGDRIDDIAVYRPGTPSTWFILNSQTNSIRVETFGNTGDDPSVVADYNADNKDDIAVYRINPTPGGTNTWFYKPQGAGFVSVTFGINSGAGGDFPAPGDYDGDNRADFVVQRNQAGTGVFYKLLTTGFFTSEVFGNGTELVVPGNFSGDAGGRTDLCIVDVVGGNFRWRYRPSEGGADVTDTWGVAATDFPIVGDYTGDGRADFAVWRSGAPGTFFALSPNHNAVKSQQWGTTGDLPTGFSFTH